MNEAVAAVVALHWPPPVKTLRTRNEVEALPNGTPVLIGEPNDPTRRPLFGHKQEHCVVIQGDPEPYPLHDPTKAPPLPCTVVWTPPDTTDFGVYVDGTEVTSVLASLTGAEQRRQAR